MFQNFLDGNLMVRKLYRKFLQSRCSATCSSIALWAAFFATPRRFETSGGHDWVLEGQQTCVVSMAWPASIAPDLPEGFFLA